jgi:hypothetical protein
MLFNVQSSVINPAKVEMVSMAKSAPGMAAGIIVYDNAIEVIDKGGSQGKCRRHQELTDATPDGRHNEKTIRRSDLTVLGKLCTINHRKGFLALTCIVCTVQGVRHR